jgi:hypothetical protein
LNLLGDAHYLEEEFPKIPSPKENYNPVNQSTTITSPGKTSQPSADIEDIDFDEYSHPDYDPDIYTDPDAEYDPIYDGVNPDSDKDDSNYDYEAVPVQTTVRPRPRSFRAQEREELSIIRAPILNPEDNKPSVNWDPDDEQLVRTRFLKIMLDERKRRHDDLQLIQRQRQELVEQRMQIDQAFRTIDKARSNLEAREAKIVEVQDILPSARKLKDSGMDLHQALVFINIIQQKAEEEKIDLKSAAYRLEEELTNYRRLGGIQKSIERANQQLAIIEAFTAQKPL